MIRSAADTICIQYVFNMDLANTICIQYDTHVHNLRFQDQEFSI